MQFFRALMGRSKKKADNSMPSHGRFESAMVYTCIAFFVIAVVFVSFTYSGKWQAGLIEVGCSAFLFVIFLHILRIVIPQSSGKIITALSAIIVVMLIYANYSLQRNKHKKYTFKEILVGDLLVRKIIGTHAGLPDELLAKRIEDVIATGADVIVTACPFCMVMMTDGIKYKNKEEEMKNYDLAELVSMSMGL